MSWPILAATAVGLVVGINLGVLLMVALQAGRKQDDAYVEAVLRARIAELEAARVQRASPEPPAVDLRPAAGDANGGPGKATATG